MSRTADRQLTLHEARIVTARRPRLGASNMPSRGEKAEAFNRVALDFLAGSLGAYQAPGVPYRWALMTRRGKE